MPIVNQIGTTWISAILFCHEPFPSTLVILLIRKALESNTRSGSDVERDATVFEESLFFVKLPFLLRTLSDETLIGIKFITIALKVY